MPSNTTTYQGEPRTHAIFARDLRALLRAQLGIVVTVDVTEWAGCDEDWKDPIYVVVEDYEENEYHDAVLDLASGDYIGQLVFALEQILHG